MGSLGLFILLELIGKDNTIGEEYPDDVQRQDELEVPLIKEHQLALALNDLVEGGEQGKVAVLLLRHLLGDILSQVTNSHDIVIYFIKLARNEHGSHLVEDHGRRMHQFYFEGFRVHFLAHRQEVVVHNLYRNVDRLAGLAELHTHLVDTIDDSFSTLEKGKIGNWRLPQK